jgi:hypothetical protein
MSSARPGYYEIDCDAGVEGLLLGDQRRQLQRLHLRDKGDGYRLGGCLHIHGRHDDCACGRHQADARYERTDTFMTTLRVSVSVISSTPRRTCG